MTTSLNHVSKLSDDLDLSSLDLSDQDVSYKHQALDNSKKELRLFQFLPPEEDDDPGEIWCQLEHYEFDIELTAPRTSSSVTEWYTAISYAWGSPSPTHEIIVNGRPFLIRANLYDCFLALQARGHWDELYWVDQLCIDQENIAERNHQVSLMGMIFSKADLVLAWLGIPDFDSEAAFQDLDAIMRSAADFVDYGASYELTGSFRSSALVGDMPTEQLAYMLKIFDRPYWRRLWIVQELYLASSVVFMCGEHTWYFDDDIRIGSVLPPLIDYLVNLESVTKTETMLEAFNLMMGYALRTRELPKQRKDVLLHNVVKGRRAYRALTMSMDTAIDLAVGRECTDPRDKVFALQMCIDLEERVLVDYSLSAEEVFVSVIRLYTRLGLENKLPDQRGERIVSNLIALHTAMGLGAPSKDVMGQIMACAYDSKLSERILQPGQQSSI